MLQGLLDRWNRRYWQPGPVAMQAPGLEPVVLVTGGSEGIGRALAMEFAGAGHDLLLVARDPAKLQRAARDIMAQHRVEVFIHHMDLVDREARRGLEEHAAALGRYVDVLVNSAGFGLSGPYASHPPRLIQDLVELNVTALSDLCRRMLPGMVARGRGGIINVSSLGGFAAGPNQAAYYASKAYVNAMTRAMAYESRGQGVRILCLAPGAVATKFHERMAAQESLYLKLLGWMTPEAVARSGFRGYRYWQRLVVPGLLPKAIALALKVLPHAITAPIIGWLLEPRRAESESAEGDAVGRAERDADGGAGERADEDAGGRDTEGETGAQED